MLWRQLFANKNHQRHSGDPTVEAAPGYVLEARMMFDGAVAATVDQAASSQNSSSEAAASQANATDNSANQDENHQQTGTQQADKDHSSDIAVAGEAVHSSKEVVFIDTAVANYQSLVNEVPQGVEVVLLDSSKDGLSQIKAWAETHKDYDAIHIVSHGSEGQIYLGGLTLNTAAISSRLSDLNAIGAALKDSGDILLYGCSVASGEGERFINALATATGADVAASDDLTGSAALGGDWTLEKQAGSESVDVDALSFSHYDQLLTVVSFDSNDLNSGAGSYAKSLNGATFTFSGKDGYSFSNNYGSNYNVFPDSVAGGDATSLTIDVQSGYSFDLTRFSYYTSFNDTITLTLTYANGSTVTGTLIATANGDINVSNFSAFRDSNGNALSTTANDVTRAIIASANGTGSYDFGTNNFDISDVKAISANDSTSTLTAGPATEATSFATTSTSVATATGLLDFTLTDSGSADGKATTVSGFYVNVSGTATAAELSQMIFLLNGPDASNVAGNYDSSTGRIVFSGLTLSIADGSSESYSIKAYYNDNSSSNDITDHHTVALAVNVSNFTAGAGGSTFAASQASVTNGSGAAIDVTATKLIYSQSPSGTVVSGVDFAAQPVLIAVDARGNIDTDFNGSVTLSENGSGALSGTTAVTAVNGVATFTGVKYTAASDADANFVLTAAASGVSSAVSASIDPDVVATRLEFSSQPMPGTLRDGQNTSFTSVPVVRAVDANGMVDQDYNGNIVLSVTDPVDGVIDGSLNHLMVTAGDQDASTTTVTLLASGGMATFTGLTIQYTNNGSSNTLALRATAASLTAINSASLISTSNQPPVFSQLNGGSSYTEDGSAVVIDNNVTVADSELDALNSGAGNYNGASVTISRNGGASSNDVFASSGQLGALVQGQIFSYNGTSVGTVTTNSAGTLLLTFNGNASTAIVNSVIQSITYSNSSHNPPASVTLNWTFSDGSLTSAGTNQALVTIVAVNDAPVIGNTAVSKTLNEDTAQGFTAADFGFTDPDSGDVLQSITVVTAPAAGQLFVDADGDGRFGSGDTLVTAGTVVSAADIARLTFRPADNASGAGYASFRWTVSDGSLSSANTGTLTLNVTPVNDAPVIGNTAVSKTLNEDTAQGFTAADFGFTDADSGDVLQSITVVTAPAAGQLFVDADGDGRFGSGDTLVTAGAVVSAADIARLTFRPADNASGPGYASFRWTVSDGSLSSANTGTLTLNVTPVNDAPTAGIIANQTLTEGNRFSLVLANGTFNDVDTGDILTLSATLADGSSLPSWLTFDPVTGSFSGTPGATDTGTLSIRVSATDRAGAQASSSFTLQIAAINSNQSPIVSGTLTDQTAPQDGRFNYTIPTNVFVDPDSGDSLSLSAAQANGSPLPSWLSFDPATQTFSGVPDTSAIGVVTIRVTATDSNQATVSATFSLSVTRAQQNLGDPEFLINDGRTSAPTTTTLRIDTAPGVPVTLGSLLAPTGAGAQNAAFLAVTTTTTSSLFQATRNGTGEKPFTGTQLSGIFSRAASEGGTTRFESALGSFPSFNQGGANGGSSSLAGLFSGISLPSLNTMEVFSGGSWRSINTSNDSTAITTASTAGFTGLRGQLQQSGDEELQRLAALEQALSEMDQRQG
ncbi:putative Ig domain-containing protein [Pantoea allii]|uniref:Putative Ig domain-containing protein n=1 Tax=Pantoea allii TaxID=574096 RepID=A0A2V2B901_9GAMM|nr:DUF4347 domain-containing protein [Pantoea allii]PWK96754.1 putative Ig domain-containing protein [Pantoea allii]